MWLALIILGLLLIYISAMCQAAGRPMPLPDETAKQRAQRQQILQEEHHAQTNHPTDHSSHPGGAERIPDTAHQNLVTEPRPDLAPVNSVAAYAYQALDRAIETKGEN